MSSPRIETRRHALRGLRLHEHRLRVPVDHADPGGPTLEIFAREVLSTRRERDRETLPALLFLQGGPGFPAPRVAQGQGWIGRALEDYRVVLLDQRGTGRSTPVSAAGLQALGPPAIQADYLANFRADSIVRDAELLRRALLGEEGRWTLLGQSFGGFASLNYLSASPEGLRGALITGGLPGLEATAEEVYRETYALQAEKNEAYYERYPEDAELARRVAERLALGETRLPDGSLFSVRGLQALGIQLGMSYGAAALHDALELAFEVGDSSERLSHVFLKGALATQAFDTNPIYALLHEMCYTQGRASSWAAERVRAEFPRFSPDAQGPLYFTGEMVYPWMFEESVTLAPLRETAELLAQRTDWPALYDVAALERNEVPVVAALYHDDAYVPRRLSLETARRVPHVEAWVTNEYQHDGLRADGARLLGELLTRLDLP